MGENQKKIAFLIVIVFMQTVFLLVPSGPRVTHDLFLLSSATCTYQEYIYFLFEHLAWCYVFFLLYREIESLKKPLFIFFALSLADFTDFLLTYNSVWGHLGNVPISFNVINMMGLLFIFFYTKGHGK